MNKLFREIIKLKEQQCDLTTSDLQGCVEVLVKDNDLQDTILSYIYGSIDFEDLEKALKGGND